MSINRWTHEELLLVFNLYCKIPLGQFHSRNPEVIKLAQLINRTPSAVAMKLTNFASFDPQHQARGVKGLSNTSKADKEAWDEFTSNWNSVAEESETLVEDLSVTKEGIDIQREIPTAIPEGATEAERIVKIRLGQRFFRDTILAAYGSCCICGIPIRSLLIASHIIPWSIREDLRLNPHNGLCLCAIHDKGFDQGLIAINETYHIAISSLIDHYLPNESLHYNFTIYQNRAISLPEKFLPDKNFLGIHRQMYFREA